LPLKLVKTRIQLEWANQHNSTSKEYKFGDYICDKIIKIIKKIIAKTRDSPAFQDPIIVETPHADA